MQRARTHAATPPDPVAGAISLLEYVVGRSVPWRDTDGGGVGGRWRSAQVGWGPIQSINYRVVLEPPAWAFTSDKAPMSRSLAVATRLLRVPSGPSDRVKTIALIIGTFTLIYRWCLCRKEDWAGLEPPHKLVDSLYFSATVFSASAPACPTIQVAVHAMQSTMSWCGKRPNAPTLASVYAHSSLRWFWRYLSEVIPSKADGMNARDLSASHTDAILNEYLSRVASYWTLNRSCVKWPRCSGQHCKIK